MAQIFFFSDIAKMAPQSGNAGDEAFGPVAGALTTKFRVTSLHKGTSGGNDNPPAIAVCAGRVRLQKDNTDSNVLTLILTPDGELLNGVPIRYFIYRGIRKDSLINGSNALIPGTLTNRLLVGNDPTNDTPDALGLAFRPASASPPSSLFAREDLDSLETIFFETTTLKAIKVNAGEDLGLFNGTGFGFEIIQGSIWDEPNLGILRNFTVTGSTPTGNFIEIPSSTAAHVEKALREKIHSYLDPAAFYGMCFIKKKELKYKDQNAIQEANIPQLIFDKLLVRFHNKSKIYLDIRNDNGLSYNFYGTYGSGEILVDSNSTTLSDTKSENSSISTSLNQTYATDSWPIKIIDGTTLNVLSTETKAALRIALCIGETFSTSVSRKLYLSHAFLYYNKKGKKKGSEIHEVLSDVKLQDVIKNDSWTIETDLAIPAVTSNSVQVPIGFCFILQYIRQNEVQPSSNAQYISTEGQWDNLFALKPNPARWQNNNLSSWWLAGNLKYVQPDLNGQQVYHGMVESGIAVDRDAITFNDARITFYYVPVIALSVPTYYKVTSGGNVTGTGGGPGMTNSFFQRKESTQLYDGSAFLKLIKSSEYKGAAEPSNPATYLNFLSYAESPTDIDPGTGDQKDKAILHSKESLYAFSFTSAEYATILGHATTNGFDGSLHPIFIQVKSRTFPRSADTNNERAYQALELRIVGYDASGNRTSFDIPFSGTNSIALLSLYADGHIYCTDEAAKFEPMPITWDHNVIFIPEPASVGVSAADHKKDLTYLASAAAKIKLYNARFYARLERMQLLGIDVIFHTNPGVKVRTKYPIKVKFDPTMPQVSQTHAVTAGDTGTGGFFTGLFPGTTTANRPSDADFNLTSLTTIPTNTYNNRYNELNVTRYVDLNRNRGITSSQVNELFLSDYTDAEIAANVFDPSKFFIEARYNYNGVGVTNNYRRWTLAGLQNLGMGTIDPSAGVTIRLNRNMYLYEPESKMLNLQAVPGYNPRLDFVITKFVHEMGHAEVKIKESFKDLIWGAMESIFDGEIDHIANPPTEIIDPNLVPSLVFSNLRLKPSSGYVNPSPISASLYAQNPAYDAQLNAEGFLAKTGPGHLRGSPTSQAAALAQRPVEEEVYKNAIYQIRSDANRRQITLTPNPPFTLKDVYDYIFINLDDAHLQ